MVQEHSIFQYDRPRPPAARSRLGIARETSLAKRRAVLQLEADDARRRKRERAVVLLQCSVAPVLEVLARLLQRGADRLRKV